MTILSTRTKEAIKTGLAMTIAYAIALSMDWESPHWAGIAVAVISLATVGQSLNKGVMRMFGTLIAATVALTLIALAPQERWLFMVYLSTWVSFCTYMMSGTKRQYFWMVCGFVCVIICMAAGPDAANAFQTAVLRAQETGLGVLVYSLVSVLLWPSDSRASFAAATSKLASTQRQLYQVYLGLMKGQGNAEQAQTLGAEAIQTQTQFNQLLNAAESDSYEVWELRRLWRRYQRLSAQLGVSLERWRESLAEVQALDLQGLLPNLAAFGAQLDLRFAEIERMLANQALKAKPTAIDLILAETKVEALPALDKAALAVTRTALQNMEALTRSLFANVADINGFGEAITVSDTAPVPRASFVLDLDRLTGVVRVMVTMWLAYLAWIYISDIPGGTTFITMSSVFAMVMAGTPQLPVSVLFVPVAGSVLFGGLIHIFVMPHLSSFLGLGALIFLATFGIGYLFAAPRQALTKVFGLAMFVVVTSISNQQTYSFLGVATTALMLLLVLVLLVITAYIPFSPRPERAFLRLLGRFFRSAEHLMSTLRWEPQRVSAHLERWRQTFHAQELAALPRKLGAWGRFINAKALPGTSPPPLQALLTSLQALSHRMQELLEVRGNPQAQFLVQELQADVRAWRLRVQETFQRLAEDPAAGDREAFRSKLGEIMDRLEERIKETLDKTAQGQLRDRDVENFYRLLGAYRGVSEALVNYAGSADVIDWAQWHEERF